MTEQKEKKLWIKIGMSNQDYNQSNQSNQSSQSIQERVSKNCKFSSSLSQQVYQKNDSDSSSYIMQTPIDIPPYLLGRANNVIQTSFEGQIHRRLRITQEQSQIQKLAQLNYDSINYEDLQQYNQELSQMPYSITPLVYSKNSRKDDVRFRKETAKIIILKIRLTEAKEVIQKLKEQFLDFAFKIRQQHEYLQQEICSKYFQLLGEYSLRVQQSVFNHKQDYQQLKFELSMINGKNILQYPVESDIMVQSNTDANTIQLKIQNESLRTQIAALLQEKDKLLRQAEAFKKKMAEIQGKASQIRESNNKLYEYIFDLQQKVAFYKEEIPKITKRIEEESEKQLEKQRRSHNQEINKNIQTIQILQEQNTNYNITLNKSNDTISSLERQNQQLKLQVKRLDQQILMAKKSLQNTSKELSQQKNQNRRLRNQIQKIQKERQESSLYRQQKRQENNSRLTHAYSTKQEKKLLQSLQIEKLVLQKQNIQLKATIQFYNKASYHPNYISHKPLPYQHPSHQQQSERDRQLQMKERQLLELQNYLEDEARKLQSKQRDIESEYVLKRAHQTKYKEYIPTQTRITHDDYGMIKNTVMNNQIKPAPQRKNHFCSSQAQAIIQKVKMRQKMKENGCTCIQPKNCRCQAYSRGSRTSQDSNSRQYLKMQTYRPSNYSPIQNQYMKKEQKSSKMKLIQEKVRRLKSQLKNSFSTMNN